MTSSAAATAIAIEEVARITDRPDDPPPQGRDQRMMVVEIDCRVMATGIPGGHIVRQGVYRYRLHKHWLPVLLAQVMTERDKSELVRCTELHEKLLKQYIADNTGSIPEDSVEYKLKAEELRARYGGSPEALFHRDNLGRQIPPFVRVEVVEDDLAAPVDEATKARAEEAAKLVVAAVGSKPATEDMSAAIAAGVSAAVEALISKGVLSVNRQNDQQHNKR
jgi:hypothetical protein